MSESDRHVPDSWIGISQTGVADAFSPICSRRRETATSDELVEYVVEQEIRSPSTDRAAVATAMYRTHLPTLEDAGLIDYDRRRDLVTTTDRTERSRPLLEFVRSWSPADETATLEKR